MAHAPNMFCERKPDHWRCEEVPSPEPTPVPSPEPTPVPTPIPPLSGTCLGQAGIVELAAPWRTTYTHQSIDARFTHWVNVPGHAIILDGTTCWVGGRVDGPYNDSSVYECDDEHCPNDECPNPCLEYHTTAGVRVDTNVPAIVERVVVSNYGDGIEASESADRAGLVIKGAHLIDIKDDAVENDWGSNITVMDSLLERVNTAFASRFRSGEDIDARANTFLIDQSLVLLHEFPNGYKQKPGHGKVFKWEKDGKGPGFSIHDSVFVVTAYSSPLILPLVDQVRSCRGNVLYWADTEDAFNEWMDNEDRGSDGFTPSERFAQLSHCFDLVMRGPNQTQEDFLNTYWKPLADQWKETH
jgi:hypothetical protein